VLTTREGETTRFSIENLEETDITVTFELELRISKARRTFRHGGIPAEESDGGFQAVPADTNAGWNYSYTCRYYDWQHPGAPRQLFHLLTAVRAGRYVQVTQGYNGSYSHTGPEQYAIDWKMQPGTPVHAARDGVVVKIKDDSDKGGPDRKFENMANYILVRHADGSIANYAHLQKAGAKVVLGRK